MDSKKTEDVVVTNTEFVYSFDCHACGCKQEIKRSKLVYERTEHICWSCGDRCIIVLNPDYCVGGFDDATVVGG